MTEKKVKTTWTAIVTSYEEVLLAIQGANALEFPLIAIPWGAEREGTLCRAFWSSDDVTPEIIQVLLERAYPFKGSRALHLVSVKSNLTFPAWGVILDTVDFRLSEF